MTKSLYFVGIAGKGMGTVAGLMQEAGYKVMGSDMNLFPPMSTMLEDLNIDVRTPYSEDNIKNSGADVYIIGNALSRGHPELEAILDLKKNYTSFPQLLEDELLPNKSPVVVSGTHGKTTTTAMLAHCLKELKEDASYLVGGVPKGQTKSFHFGKSPFFVIEGDEYDTAFFDKEPKFLHYRPEFLIVNNIEFDHADIFKDLEDIYEKFSRLVNLIAKKSHIIVNISDPGVYELFKRLDLLDQVTKVSTNVVCKQNSFLRVTSTNLNAHTGLWEGHFILHEMSAPPTLKLHSAFHETEEFQIVTQLEGPHNIANVAMALTCLLVMQSSSGRLETLSIDTFKNALASFQGVEDRMSVLYDGDIKIIRDYAHHPSSVKLTLETLRAKSPDKRIIAAFEPKNATSRRNIFTDAYRESLDIADAVYIAPCPVDKRIPEGERMDTVVLAGRIGDKAKAFSDFEEMKKSLQQSLKAGDVCVFMSPSDFGLIQFELANYLKNR